LLIINIFFNVETQSIASPACKSNLANPLVWRETQSIASLQESRLQLCHYCFFQLELVDTRNDGGLEQPATHGGWFLGGWVAAYLKVILRMALMCGSEK
jgi:hypothetical protein